MENKVCLVTGGTRGIGHATALGLAKLGATVIIVGRDEEAGNTAVVQIQTTANNPHITFIPADLAQQAEIHRLADHLKIEHPRLDILINNAGIIAPERQLTPDGLEYTLAVNHLAPFLLTYLLLPLLQASAPARIITVASQAHSHTLDFDNLQGEKSYDPLQQYKVSKLANILFTFELARRLDNSSQRVVTNCLHPGVIQTQLLADYEQARTVANPLKRAVHTIRGWFQSTPAGDPTEQGAARVLHLATSPETGQMSGHYWHGDQPAQPAPIAQDPTVAQKLWEISANLTNVN